jgi:hypothetical protein
MIRDGAHRALRGSGPLDEKTRPPFEDSALRIGDRRTQQPQPAGWAAFVARWLLPLRSFEARALRRVGSVLAMAGALRNVRDAPAPQAGQAHGSRNSAIGRIAVNGPHAWQS